MVLTLQPPPERDERYERPFLERRNVATGQRVRLALLSISVFHSRESARLTLDAVAQIHRAEFVSSGKSEKKPDALAVAYNLADRYHITPAAIYAQKRKAYEKLAQYYLTKT